MIELATPYQCNLHARFSTGVQRHLYPNLQLRIGANYLGEQYDRIRFIAYIELCIYKWATHIQLGWKP